MFTKDSKVVFEVHDAGVEDGDMINIYIDGKLFLENYIVKNKPKSFEIELNKESVLIEIEAINEGEAPPNTSDIVIKDSVNELKTITKLQKNNRTSIDIVKLEQVKSNESPTKNRIFIIFRDKFGCFKMNNYFNKSNEHF